MSAFCRIKYGQKSQIPSPDEGILPDRLSVKANALSGTIDASQKEETIGVVRRFLIRVPCWTPADKVRVLRALERRPGGCPEVSPGMLTFSTMFA